MCIRDSPHTHGQYSQENRTSRHQFALGKHVPHVWKKAEIIPILKKGKQADSAEGYRPISLTSVLCKLAETMITNRLNQLVEAKQIVDQTQAGSADTAAQWLSLIHI